MKFLVLAAVISLTCLQVQLVSAKADPRMKDVPPDVRRMLEKKMKGGPGGAGGMMDKGKGQKPFITNFGQECLFSCPNGVKPIRRLHHVPKFDGCGLPPGAEIQGIDFRTTKDADFRSCCNDCDKCYNSCGKTKEACDAKFSKCMTKWCDVMFDEEYLEEPTEEAREALKKSRETCSKRGELFHTSHKLMGCQMYLDAQMDACSCGQQSVPSPKQEL